jgi:hypothetical protein
MRALVLATALLIAQPSLAFDGNDRILDVDSYQKLPANPEPYAQVVDYTPYGSQVDRSAPSYGYGPEPVESQSLLDWLTEPARQDYYQQTQYRPLDGSVRNSAYYEPRRYYTPPKKKAYGYASNYRPRDVACKPSVSAATALSRGGVQWAKNATEKAWRNSVAQLHGAQYASFSLARGKSWDCQGTLVAHCRVTATPCRSAW